MAGYSESQIARFLRIDPDWKPPVTKKFVLTTPACFQCQQTHTQRQQLWLNSLRNFIGRGSIRKTLN